MDGDWLKQSLVSLINYLVPFAFFLSLLQVQANALSCIERVLDQLEKTEILDHVLPILIRARLSEPEVLAPAISRSHPFLPTLRPLISQMMPIHYTHTFLMLLCVCVFEFDFQEYTRKC